MTLTLFQLILVPLARKRLGCFDMGANQKTDVTVSASQDTGNEGSGSIEQAEVTPEDLIRQFNELRVLDTVYEGNEEEAGDQSPEVAVKCSPSCGPTTLPLKQFIAGTPNRFPFRRLRHSKKLTAQQKILKFLKKCRALTFDRKIEYDRGTFVHHLLAEKFNEKIEAVFRFLLILVAAATALAHGSNDVPTIMGPFADILNIFKNHSALSEENSTQIWDMDVWVRALGAIGVSVGYAVWGWRLVRCLGGRITFLSPSRAFSAQICTLATVVAVSKIGIPVSTTHIFIGALLGVSIADNLKNINWQLVCVLIMMWGLMLAFTTGTAVALYAFTIFSPSVPVRE